MKYMYLFVMLTLFSCEITQKEKEVEGEPKLEVPKDFYEFYAKFHADTVFQLQRITFPLSGKPSSGQFEFEVSDFKWTRDGWRIHKAFQEEDDTFSRKFVVHAPGMISEFIYTQTFGFYMERRFAKLSDGWNLIYFADMQQR